MTLSICLTALLLSQASLQTETKSDPAALLRRLSDGNRRFVQGTLAHPRQKPADYRALAAGQHPFAVVVGCADSRVPPEIVFDEGVGDLFTVRVAGNVIQRAGPAVAGSIEYAVEHLHVPLLVVLGHSQCGAVKAALEHRSSSEPLPGSIKGLVDAILPSIASVQGKPGDAVANAVRANVDATVAYLKGMEPIVAPEVRHGKVKVVGALYEIESGSVRLIPSR